MSRPAHALVSYWYLKKSGRVAWLKDVLPEGTDFFLDSGAFSAQASGAEIDLDEYIAFIVDGGYKTYANLDVIGDSEASYANQRRMEDAGLHPIPVVHGGEPWRHLDRYVEEGHGYIALGGIARALGALRWCAEAFARCPEGTLFHGFGQTKYPLLKALPWYSVDSTSHGALNRWAEFMGFNGHKVVSISLKKYKIRPETKRDLARQVRHGLSADYESMDLLKTDIDAKRLRDGTSTNSAKRLGYAAGRTAGRVEEWMLDRHGRVGEDGPKIYMALGSEADPFAVKGMHDYFEEQGLQ